MKKHKQQHKRGNNKQSRTDNYSTNTKKNNNAKTKNYQKDRRRGRGIKQNHLKDNESSYKMRSTKQKE